MKIALYFMTALSIPALYLWWQSHQSELITLPSDSQLNEMVGLYNTPTIPLTTTQN
ncbi:MAG: hypothetical protein ABJH25_07135 [Marinomonas sp.]